MINNNFFNIFRKGSKTFFYSSLFFPSSVRQDVFTFYGFVRTADDFVDSVPQQKKQFLKFESDLLNALSNKPFDNHIIASFMQVAKKYQFKKSWILSFIQAMHSDLNPKKELTQKELNQYIYGSAEVIGLMLAAIFKLPEAAYPAARKMGKAMQLINFIRDIDEDNKLKRIYFTKQDLAKYSLKDLSYSTALKKPVQFKQFIQTQIKIYRKWNAVGKAGFKYLPFEILLPVKTATSMYEWTATQIENDPFVVYQKKVKPQVHHILYQIGKNYLPL